MNEEVTLYVVEGSTGKYSGHRRWLVCAYSNEDMARRHAETAKIEARRIEFTSSRYQHQPDEAAKAWDSHMDIDYTGTDYTGTDYIVVTLTVRNMLPA